ncbi:MAG TPA: hypothetical protein VGY32_11320 [Solirubrobacteraceae bacterium]|nr:hypothetical protein [Solirubrobacteraceae bacterium]
MAVAAPALGSTQSAARSTPSAFRWSWRLVTAEPNQAAADDRYAAVIKGRNPGPYELTLIDQQRQTRKDLKAPDCPQPSNPRFGGPWLMVGCGGATFGLYNLSGQRWKQFVVSPQCTGCGGPSLGRYWVKFVSQGGCIEHCGQSYVLQNIATGQLMADPAKPGGGIFDDLDAPAGSSRLCPPLRYPDAIDTESGRSYPGALTFKGQFALAEGTVRRGPYVGPGWSLERCHSRRKIEETDDPALLSSRAFAWIAPDFTGGHVSYDLIGHLLPGTQGFRTKLPTVFSTGGADLVALSQRTVYVETTYTIPAQLWEARLPAPANTR